jgi:hypothetical protein
MQNNKRIKTMSNYRLHVSFFKKQSAWFFSLSQELFLHLTVVSPLGECETVSAGTVWPLHLPLWSPHGHLHQPGNTGSCPVNRKKIVLIFSLLFLWGNGIAIFFFDVFAAHQ